MKLIIVLTLIILFVLQFSCKNATEPTGSDIYVAFNIQAIFNDDSVKLSLDDTTLLDARVNSKNVFGLAWSSGLLRLSRNSHKLNFLVVRYGVQKDYSVETINDTSTVILDFSKDTKEITINQIKGLVAYE